jgi:hypothetical protein
MKYDAFTLRQAQGERVGLSTIEDYPFVLSLSKHEPIGKTHQDLDFRVPRAACCPCFLVALADKPPVAPKQVVLSSNPYLAVAFL